MDQEFKVGEYLTEIHQAIGERYYINLRIEVTPDVIPELQNWINEFPTRLEDGCLKNFLNYSGLIISNNTGDVAAHDLRYLYNSTCGKSESRGSFSLLMNRYINNPVDNIYGIYDDFTKGNFYNGISIKSKDQNNVCFNPRRKYDIDIVDINQTILLYLDYYSIMSAGRASAIFFRICRMPSFWERKALKDFKISSSAFNDIKKRDNKARYEYLMNIKFNIGLGLEDAAENGSLELAKYFVSLGAKNYNSAMSIATKHGHIDIVKLMISKGANNYDETMIEATKSGNMEIVKLMIHKGANNYNETLVSAASVSNIEIMRYMKYLGANDYNTAMADAAKIGDIEIVRYMLSFGANNYNLAMEYASEGDHIEIVELMLSKGANDYNKAMIGAARHGHIEIIRYMLSLGADDYNSTMSCAAEGGHIDIVKLMIDKGANDYNATLFYSACKGHIEIVKLMLSLGGNNYKRAIYYSRKKGHKEIVQLLTTYKDRMR